MPPLTPGRVLFCLGNLFYTAGSFFADWNQTHIHNPRWPPHAKFHNGQTMSLGVLLCLASTYFAFRPAFSKLSPGEAKHSVLCAAAIGSMYCTAGVSAILYPGTNWFDPEYEMKGMTQREIFVLVSEWRARCNKDAWDDLLICAFRLTASGHHVGGIPP